MKSNQTRVTVSNAFNMHLSSFYFDWNIDLQVGYIADNSVPNGLPFVFLPDYNIKGLENTLRTYMSYDVEQIIFSHSNFEDPLTPGTKDNLQFWLDYIKVV